MVPISYNTELKKIQIFNRERTESRVANRPAILNGTRRVFNASQPTDEGRPGRVFSRGTLFFFFFY